jgi:hypothetical protein
MLPLPWRGPLGAKSRLHRAEPLAQRHKIPAVPNWHVYTCRYRIRFSFPFHKMLRPFVVVKYSSGTTQAQNQQLSPFGGESFGECLVGNGQQGQRHDTEQDTRYLIGLIGKWRWGRRYLFHVRNVRGHQERRLPLRLRLRLLAIASWNKEFLAKNSWTMAWLGVKRPLHRLKIKTRGHPHS